MHLKYKFFFVETLLLWHRLDNRRVLPWKLEQDPYKIWLSEIMLQQTQAQTVVPYYLKFVKAFPTITHLAQADMNIVFKMWEGLGYYSRCRNMIYTAKEIDACYGGVFPSDYKTVIGLKGVGDYTAAAILSFAFDLHFGVVDGNVYRILARFFGIELSVDDKEGKKFFYFLAQDLLPPTKGRDYNQAIMDFGATVCRAKKPICDACVLQKKCWAFNNNRVNDFPVKVKKVKILEREIKYSVFLQGKSVYIHQRKGKDIWQDLFDFYEVEGSFKTLKKKLEKQLLYGFDMVPIKKIYKQILTHQKIKMHFVLIELDEKEVFPFEGFLKEKIVKTYKYAFPKILKDFIQTEIMDMVKNKNIL